MPRYQAGHECEENVVLRCDKGARELMSCPVMTRLQMTKQQAERQHPDAEDRQEKRRPPRISSKPAGMRSHRPDGWRKKRTVAASEVGRRLRSFARR